MKKVNITIIVIGVLVVAGIIAGFAWHNVEVANQAKEQREDADFYTQQKAKIDEARKNQIEYNRSIGRPDNAN